MDHLLSKGNTLDAGRDEAARGNPSRGSFDMVRVLGVRPRIGVVTKLQWNGAQRYERPKRPETQRAGPFGRDDPCGFVAARQVCAAAV